MSRLTTAVEHDYSSSSHIPTEDEMIYQAGVINLVCEIVNWKEVEQQKKMCHNWL